MIGEIRYCRLQTARRLPEKKNRRAIENAELKKLFLSDIAHFENSGEIQPLQQGGSKWNI
ncbi:MAG: hypothetical protein ACI92I_000776 [Acidimicrobiales bacterium]|jgi:hypothetical protein